MFRVIETVQIDENAFPNRRDVPEGISSGLYVLLDLAQKTPPPIMMDAAVRVHRPDGSTFETVVSGIEVWRPNVGLFFRDTEKDEIPVSSEIEVVAG
jgi:hypothetical protein